MWVFKARNLKKFCLRVRAVARLSYKSPMLVIVIQIGVTELHFLK